MKMKYTEQAVETLDGAGSVIANKNIEIEQLRQRVAELEKERDELNLVVSAHADFFSSTQSEMADLKESVECLSATNDFLIGKRDENIILKAAVKQLTAERDAALAELSGKTERLKSALREAMKEMLRCQYYEGQLDKAVAVIAAALGEEK